MGLGKRPGRGLKPKKKLREVCWGLWPEGSEDSDFRVFLGPKAFLCKVVGAILSLRVALED